MAKLTGEQRQDIRTYARKLILSGKSRRSTEEATKTYSLRRYGVKAVLGHTLASKYFNERAEFIKQKEEARPAPKRRFRLNRGARYDWLIARHFTDDEATRLSHLRNIQQSKGVAEMVEVRRKLWDKFIRRAAYYVSDKGRRDAWRGYLAKWYRDNGYITKKIHKGEKRATIWGWYKDIQKQLPEEDRDDTPRLHDRGFTTRQYVTPALVDWTKSLNSIRGLMERKGRTPELRREERRVLGKIREAKRR